MEGKSLFITVNAFILFFLLSLHDTVKYRTIIEINEVEKKNIVTFLEVKLDFIVTWTH